MALADFFEGGVSSSLDTAIAFDCLVAEPAVAADMFIDLVLLVEDDFATSVSLVFELAAVVAFDSELFLRVSICVFDLLSLFGCGLPLWLSLEVDVSLSEDVEPVSEHDEDPLLDVLPEEELEVERLEFIIQTRQYNYFFILNFLCIFILVILHLKNFIYLRMSIKGN